MNSVQINSEVETLILANHILHYQHVLDAYGHVSVRHPGNPDVFIMSGDRAPALVSSPSDLIAYNISDSSPVYSVSKKGYQERFIHSEIYKRYPAVNSVIHSHADAVLPYTMNGVPMKPAFHIAGFLGTHVPIYDIMPLYQPGDQQNMLVNSERFGSALAAKFSSTSLVDKTDHDHNVVLMSNHGFTVVGSSVKQAVYRAVYTRINASIQSQALMLRSAASFMSSALSDTGDVPSSSTASISGSGNSGLRGEGSGGLGEMRFLDKKEQSEGCMKMNDSSQDRPWALWVKEVKSCPLYDMEDLETYGHLV